MLNRYLWLGLLVWLGCQTTDPMMDIPLDSGWTFRAAGDTAWLPATVPGVVHLDLLALGKIEDPFYRTNERDQQWIDKQDWEYQTTFTAGPDLLALPQAELTFEGLDTYAEVYLNDSLVLQADNMFRRWVVPVGGALRPGANTLRVYLHSPIKVGLQKYDSQGFVIPVSDNDQSQTGGLGDKKVSVYTRKAGYHFGWDWGPRLVTSGIWRPVRLRAWKGPVIRDLFVKQESLSPAEAQLVALVEVECGQAAKGDWVIRLNGAEFARLPATLTPGLNRAALPFSLTQPKLWWPNGLGEPYRYQVTIALEAAGHRIAQRTVPLGLRSLELVQEPDSAGASFYFRVNGEPLFMKGANYIPQDNFLPRVGPERYEHILESARATHMNMIRIWGGGVYEDELFYELCDQKGLLVWQDFMFACAMFPGDDAFLENVRQEAIDNVRRLRQHPSIALWCGNNENLSAWEGWGWKQQVEATQGPEVAAAIWHAYDTLFHHILPGVVAEYDPDRPYWASSPQAAQGVKENWLSGDVHYWGVWWGKEPFSNYAARTPRFMSEYGFQSFPELATVRQFAEEADWDIYSEVMQAHQRSSIGNGTIDTYMKRHYLPPKDFPSFLYVGQVLQAEGLKVGMESHRRQMPYCMGSLFWQIDDCWPVASWSSIDYYGRWKALQYYARRAFSPVLVSLVEANGQVQAYAISDLREALPARLQVQVLTLAGEVVFADSQQLTLAPNQSQQVWSRDREVLLDYRNPAELVVSARLWAGDSLLSQNAWYFVSPKDMTLPEPGLRTEVTPAGSDYAITLRAERLARHVWLSVPGLEGQFSDNYFDLMPGETRVVTYKPAGEVANLQERLQVWTLREAY